MRMQDAEPLRERGGLRHEFFGGHARFVRGAAEHCIYQSCGGSFARDFHQLDGFIYCRAGRNALQKSQLVESDSQCDGYRQIQLCDWLLQMLLEQKIEEAAPAQDAHHQFGCQAGVFWFYACAQLGVQQVAGVCAFGFDAAQHFVGDFSGGADHEPNRSPGCRRAPFANSRAEILLRPSSCADSRWSVVSSPHATFISLALTLIVAGGGGGGGGGAPPVLVSPFLLGVWWGGGWGGGGSPPPPPPPPRWVCLVWD